MALSATTMALVLPLVFADSQPGSVASTFPEIPISKAQTPHEWPFSVEAGTLSCISVGELDAVFFSEPWREDVPQEFGNMTLPRMVVVSANPLALFASFEDRDLYLPWDSLETLVKRLAPFETMGRKLCAQEAPQQKTL